MRICITLDDVIRNKTFQIGKVYKKYINNDINLKSLDFSTNDYCKIFNFKSKNEYNKFLYEDYVFQIFAEADACENQLGLNLNKWLLKLNDIDEDEDEPVDVMLSNINEFNISIAFTYFFLSKIGTRIRKVFFPIDKKEIWDNCDVLVTANPELLNDKPEGKKTIKINTDYNSECKSDFEYDFLSEFLRDEEIINKLKNNK